MPYFFLLYRTINIVCYSRICIRLKKKLKMDNEFFHISPNPASDVVNVFSSFKIHDLSIYATDGRLMKRERVDGLSKNVDISMLPKGMYIVRATTVHGMAYGRLVVQ